MVSSKLSLMTAGALLSSAVSAATCSKYTVKGSDNSYQFSNYLFQDYRKADTSYLTSSDYTSTWAPMSWSNEKFTNKASNVKVFTENGQSMLRLTAERTGGVNTAAEIDTKLDDLYYASIRIAARVSGAPGACAGLFFYHDDTQETDIEILTREQTVHQDADNPSLTKAGTTAQLHFTNQGKPRSDTATMDLTPANSTSLDRRAAEGSWEDFNIYRIDWVPGTTYWWQNGEMSHSSQKFVIENPAQWIFNIWSNEDPSWSGTMADGAIANMDILWMEMAYNRLADGAPATGAGSDATCTLSEGDGKSLTGNDSGAGSGIGSGPVATPPASSPSATSAPASIPTATSTPGSGAGPLVGGVQFGSIDECGSRNSSAVCATGMCCSTHGYCGTSGFYCGLGCQGDFGACRSTS